MIKNTTQRWQVGSRVRVGFLTLTVKAAIHTPGDGLPDVYFLANLAGDKLYEFTPHRGLQRTTLAAAEAKISEFHTRIARIAATETAKAIQRAHAASAVREFFGGDEQERAERWASFCGELA